MTRCDKIISDLNCNIIVQDEQFEYLLDDQGEYILDEHEHKIPTYVYVYVLQFNGVNKSSTWSIIKEAEDDELVFSEKEDGYYTLCTIKVPRKLNGDDELPQYYFDGGRFWNKNSESEVSIQELITVNPEFSGLEIIYDNYFSVCHLRKCFIRMCQEIFNSRATIRCETKFKDSLTYNRDLVWAALNVIQYLVDFEQYGEAQRILERISGCNGLCKESKGRDCGCL